MEEDCSGTERNCSETEADGSICVQGGSNPPSRSARGATVESRATVIAFGPFRLLPAQQQLWRDENLVELRPTSLAVLSYLAQQPERVVAVEELRQAVWGGTYVSRTTIRVCLREVRQALGDEAATPRYIETVGRRGY